MQKNLTRILIIFIIIFSFNIFIISKEDKNGVNKKRNSDKNSQKDKKGIQQNIKKNSINDKRDDNKKSYVFKEDVDFNRKGIISYINKTEIIKKKLKIFQRIIKQTDNDFINIQKQYHEVINEIEKNNNEDLFLSLNFNDYQKNEIKEQIEVIVKSKAIINSLVLKLKKEFDISEKNKKSILIKSIELEKEFNKLNKQYRAIDWILYEQ